MWSRVLGLSDEKRGNTSTSSGRRKDEDEKRPERKRTTSSRKSSGTEEKDRGMDPTTTSYSSSSRAPYSGVASASVASSYATAQSNNTDETILPLQLAGDTSLANRMPKSQSEREERSRDDNREGEKGRKKDRSTSRDRKRNRENRSRSRDREERRRDRKERREKRQERDGGKDRGLSKSENDYKGTSRTGESSSGTGNFSAQVKGSGFTQFPGQFDGGMPGLPSGPPHPPHMSDHVPDQFPGQFPSGTSAPYRPPLSVEQGGPGLAADYYGDAGESVATQPGVRPQAPTLIVGAQPHLMAASPVEAPPIEPSSTGGVGAAASFFSDATFESPSGIPKLNQPPGRPTGVASGAPPQPAYSSQPSGFEVPAALAGTTALGYIASSHGETPHGPTQGLPSNPAGSYPPQTYTRPPSNIYPTTSIPPSNNYHSSSAPIIPSLGSAAIGAAAGYMMASHTSQQQQPTDPPLPIQGSADYRPSKPQLPPQQIDIPQGSYSAYDRPQQPGKQSPSSSNIPLYAAGALGAAGLAAAAYHHEHHDSAQDSYTAQSQPSAFMPHKHRHSGPLSKFVDFFRDPEGVAQFEEYTEYIGVCRYCFAPGSSPREAPRKHYYRRKRSNERLGASIRVDKESRYSSSDGESRRRNKNSSWIASGIAGIGLAKVGESLFPSNRDFDDTYSVRSGRVNQSTAFTNGRRYNNSPDRKSSISHGTISEPTNVHSMYDEKRRSTLKDHETGIGEAALVAAMGAASVAESSSRKHSRSPRGTLVGSKPRSKERDYEYGSERRRKERTGRSPQSTYIEVTGRGDHNEKGRDSRKKKKKRKNGGLFNFANSSSSDTGLVVHTGSDRSRSKKSSRTKIKDHNDANAALIGLGAAAAALAAAEGRKSDVGKRKADMIAIKEVRMKDGRRSDERRVHPQKPTYPNVEEAQWESASEEVGYSSVDSTLAYGVSRRSSQDSLRSGSSGTNKWGWRWGSSSRKPKDKPKGESSLTETIVGTAAGLAGAAAGVSVFADEDSRHPARSGNSSLPPLQHVYPVATSDPSHYDFVRHDSITSGNQPIRTSRPAAIPLQQPQPAIPLSSVIYVSGAPYDHTYSAPAGPPVFAQPPQPTSSVPGYGIYNGYSDVRQGVAPVQYPSEQAVMAAVPQAVAGERKPRRRASSPTPEIIHIEPRQPKRSSTRDDMSAVRFDLTEEQRNKEFRDRERERKNSDLSVREEGRQYVNEDVDTDGKRRRSKKSSRSGDSSRRDEQPDMELDRLRKQEDPPAKQEDGNSWVAPTLVGVAGAMIGASAAEGISNRVERREARRDGKPDDHGYPSVVEIHKQKQNSDVEDEGQSNHDERQKAMAKKAAALVKRTPSPAHQDYSSFFAPTEFLSKSKEKTIVDDSNGGNDITTYSVPQIITIKPSDQQDPSSSIAYTFLDANEEGHFDPNHMRLPWSVPRVNLIHPTPPASMAGSVRGDASPILRPEDAHVSEDEEHEQTEKDSKRVKVTFGDSETREYEVVTPKEHRDEFVKDISEDRTIEEEKTMDQAIPVTLSHGAESPVEEVTRDHMPGDFGDDCDFAATLAAGLEDSGFDPAIVIDDPTYRRRDSPPGSESREFYRKPFFDNTVEDLSLDSPGTEGAPPQRGFVEGEIPPTPKDELPIEVVQQAEDGKNKLKDLVTEAETVEEPNDNVRTTQKEGGYKGPHHNSDVPEIIEVTPRTILDDYSGSPIDQRPQMNGPSSAFNTDKDEFEDASEFASADNGRREVPDIQPEAGDALEAEADFISTKNRIKKSKGRGNAQGQDNDAAPYRDLVSNAFTPPLPNESEEPKRSKKKSKRKTSEYKDTASAVSSPASFDTEKDVNDELENGTAALRPGDMDLTDKPADQAIDREAEEAGEATLDDFEKPKKKAKKSKSSKYKADEEWFNVEPPEPALDAPKVEEDGENQNQKSSSKKDKRKKNGRRNGNEDSGMVTQEIPAENGDLEKEMDTSTLQYLDDHDPDQGIPRSSELDQPLSFLGMRREVTEPPDISSRQDPGSTIRRISSEETFRDAIRSKIIEQGLPPLPASRPTSPTAVGSTGDLPALPPSRTASPVATPGGQRRRLSMLQLADSSLAGSSPSPTAVPLIFPKFASSIGVIRSTPSSPAPSPRTAVPFSPRQRQGRPLSTEFKKSTEFRPLWLVERHNPSRRGQGPEVTEDVYPSLPSSHSTSRASSVHYPDIDDSYDTHGDEAFDKGVTRPQEILFSLAHNSDHKNDFLDSQQPTPTRDSFFAERETGSTDPMQHRSSQFVPFPPQENDPDLESLDHKEKYPEDLPPLPRSRESSPYEETIGRNDFTTAKGVSAGAVAAGALVTISHSTPRTDQDYDLSETRTGKFEPEETFHVAPAERFGSEPSPAVLNDDLEAYRGKEDKKKKAKKQRKANAIASADSRVLNDEGKQDAQNENNPTREVALVQTETDDTWFSSTPSKKAKKDKKGKSKSKSRGSNAPDVGDVQPERTVEIHAQSQLYETAPNDHELQPQLDKELSTSSDTTRGSIVVAAAAAAAELALNAESSSTQAVSTLQADNDNGRDFSTKSKKGKKQKGKRTVESFEAQFPAEPSNTQEAEELNSGTRDFEMTKEEELFDFPFAEKSKKAKNSRKYGLPQEFEEDPTKEADRRQDAVAPKDDAEIPSSFSEIPEVVNCEIMPEPSTIDDQLDAMEPMQAEMVSPEAVALPTDDDLDLLPALPPDSPLLEPQSTSDFVAEETFLPKASMSMEDSLPRMTASDNSSIASEIHLPRDVMESRTRDVEIAPKEERPSPVETAEVPETSAEDPHGQSSDKDSAVGTDEPRVMRDLVSEGSGFEQQVNLELDHPSDDFVKPQEAQGSLNRTPTVELTKEHSIEEERNTIDVNTPTANATADPFLVTAREAPTPYEEPPTSMYYTPAQDTEVVDGYFDKVEDDDKEVIFPTFKKGKKSKKGRKSQSVTPLEELLSTKSKTTDPSDAASAFVPEEKSERVAEETSSVADEPVVDEWPTSSKKKGKKARKSQPVTPREQQSSIDRSIAEPPDRASPSAEVTNSSNISEDAFAVRDEPATDEWATSKKKGKKGKRKDVSYEEADLTRNGQTEVEDIADVRDFEQSPVETVQDPVVTSAAVEDQKNIAERDDGFSTSAVEFPSARTDTAKEVSDMLGSLDKESPIEVGLSGISGVSRGLPETEIQASSDAIEEEDAWSGYTKERGKKLKKMQIPVIAAMATADPVEDEEWKKDYSIATTDTAAEVRDMLTITDDVDLVTPAQGGNQFGDDDGFPRFITKTNDKKGKENTTPKLSNVIPLDDMAVSTVPSFADVSTESINRIAGSIDAFSMLKSEKDKSTRQAISRSASDYQDASKSSGMITENAADRASMFTIPVSEPNQDLMVNEAASIALPIPEVDELVEEYTPEREVISLPLQDPVHPFKTAPIEEFSTTSLPTDETDDLEEREGKSEKIAPGLDQSPGFEHPRNESGSPSQYSLTEARNLDTLKEAILLPLPEDIQNDFIESTELAREMVPSVDEVPIKAVGSSNAIWWQPETIETTQLLERGIHIPSATPESQQPAALYAEEEAGAVGQDNYNTNSMLLGSVVGEQKLENVRSSSQNSPSELEEQPVTHTGAPHVVADEVFKSFRDETEVQPVPESFPNQSEEPATTSSKAVDALPATKEQNSPLIADDGFLGFKDTKKDKKKDKKKKKSSTFDGREESTAASVPINLSTEPDQPLQTFKDFEKNLSIEPEPITSIDNESFSASKKGKKDKKKKKSSFLSWEDEPIAQAIEEPPAEALIRSESISRDFMDPSPPEAEPLTSIEDDGFSMSKKNKKGKKNRKSSTLDSTREPSPVPEIDQEFSTTPAFGFAEIMAAKPLNVPLLPSGDQEIASKNVDLFDLPKDKKGKKKSKKSQALDWPDETATLPALIEPETTIPTFGAAEALPTEREEPPSIISEEQTIISNNEEDPFQPPKGKKGKKKLKKSQALDWANEPTNIAAPSESDLHNEINQVDVLQVPEMERTESQSPAEEPESETFSLKKSKKDKKKAKKGTRLVLDEESVHAPKELEDETMAEEIPEIPLDRDIVQPEVEDAKPQGSYEEEPSENLGALEQQMGSSKNLLEANVEESTLPFGDKNNDQELYPALGFEEGVVQEPDDIRATRTVGEPDDILEREAVLEPKDVNEPRPVLKREASHERGDFQEPQRESGTEPIQAQEPFKEAAAGFEARDTLESEISNEPKAALKLENVKALEPSISRSSIQAPLEPMPETEQNQGMEPESSNLTDTVKPQEDELFLPFETKKKKKKGKRSGPTTPLNLETRNEPAPLVAEEPLLTLGDIGLGTEAEGLQRSQSLERGVNENVFEKNEHERSAVMLEPDRNDLPTAEDGFPGFMTKKKNKKGKKSRQLADSGFEEPLNDFADPLEEGAIEPVAKERTRDVAEASSSYSPERMADSLEATTQDIPVTEDDFAGFATKKKGKKGKKSRQSEEPIYEVPAMERETQEPILLEADGDVGAGPFIYGEERAEDVPKPNTQDDLSLDGKFAGFTTKQREERTSRQSANLTFEDPASETAIMGSELRERDRAIGESPSTYEPEGSPEMLDSRTQDDSAVKDDFESLAIQKTSKKSSRPRDVTFEEPPTIPEELQIPITANEEAFPEVVEPFAKTIELPRPTEGIFEPVEPILPNQLEDDLSSFGAIKRKKTKKSKKEQPVIWEDETATYGQDEDAHQGGSTDNQATDTLETTEATTSHVERDTYKPIYLGEDTQVAAFPADISDHGKSTNDSSRNLRTDESGAPTKEDKPNTLDQQNELDPRGRALATEKGSLEYTRSLERESSIREISSQRQTEEVRHEASGLEPNAEEIWDVPTTKKGKKGKKQYFDLGQTSPAAYLQEGHSKSDRERDMSDRSDKKMSSRKDLSINDVPVVQPQDTRELEAEQEYSMSRGQERDIEPHESRSTVKPLVGATAVGAGIALFEDLARRDSISASKKDKKNKRNSDRYTDWEEEKQREPVLEQSPESSRTEGYHEPLDKLYLGEGPTRALSPQYDATRNRDSAIHVAESPIPGAKSPLHYSIRDSGYQGNDASPTLQEVLALPRQNRLSSESSPRGIEHDISPVRDYEKSTIAQSHQSATQSYEGSHNPLNISIEVDPAYNVSISRPVHEQEARREPSLGRSHELEVGLPSSYSEHHEQYQPPNSASSIRHYDNRQPSPVDSTTRDRSSVLFQSSPSTREDDIHTRPRGLSTEDTTEHSRDLELPRQVDERYTPTKSPNHRELSVTNENESRQAPTSSLFGGPVGVNSDVQAIISPPRTPNSSSRRQLDSISEYGLDDSPLQRKSQRISDDGMREPSIIGTQRSVAPQRQSQQRVRSPLGNYTEGKQLVTTDDIISRLSRPAVDEENHSVDVDRSKSRDIDTGHRSSSRHSSLPALATDLTKPREPDFRSISGASIRSGESISAYIRSPEVQSPATPPLRRVDRSVSSDLRAANRRGGANQLAKLVGPELDPEPGFASSSTYDPATDKGKERITKMADVYEGWGDVHGSPRSPTRPPSMRKRQSMQLLDLETRIDQLVSENRVLQDAKARADRQLGDAVQDHSQQKSAFDDAIRTRDLYVQQKNSELNELRGILEGLQHEVSRLTEINEGLSGSTRELTSDHEQRYSQLEDDHADIHEKWQESTRELEELRQQHASLSVGMEGIVRHEVDLALESKDVELRQMRDELETAKDQVRRLQQQILASRSSDDIIVARDEDYFDSQCQQLCQHVQQWVLRFSKFSDMKPCHSINDVADEKISDRFDNAILDGSDVDIYLADRIKRRDVFMSVVMTMVWEYIFTRYLFGMDREQRQKLKSLEKTLSEVGPARAVNKWRATTLTMLARRDSFLAQRQQDTEAVVREIYDTLAVLLPPPGHLVAQITESLRKVMTAAVDLAIEMRCQLCEYIMLPPLQPEYDTNGDLARKVFFNAALMNERSGDTASNDELVAQQAVVRMVLFPLVVKKGDDEGVGDEEIVVCPAQVLVARESEGRSGKKTVRVVSAQSQRAEGMSAAGQSVQSFAPSSMDAGVGGRF
ncbi:hypothetical protein MMC18_006534 [Xylographa bjoerkii]|nr:hypothetical protein [Xylographa bjoerkii]